MIRMRTSLRLLISILQRERSNRQYTHRHINRQLNRLTQSNKQLSVVMHHTLRVFCRGQKQNGKSILFSNDILLALEIFHPPQGNFWLRGEFLFSWGKKVPTQPKRSLWCEKISRGNFFQQRKSSRRKFERSAILFRLRPYCNQQRVVRTVVVPSVFLCSMVFALVILSARSM